MSVYLSLFISLPSKYTFHFNAYPFQDLCPPRFCLSGNGERGGGGGGSGVLGHPITTPSEESARSVSVEVWVLSIPSLPDPWIRNKLSIDLAMTCELMLWALSRSKLGGWRKEEKKNCCVQKGDGGDS